MVCINGCRECTGCMRCYDKTLREQEKRDLQSKEEIRGILDEIIPELDEDGYLKSKMHGFTDADDLDYIIMALADRYDIRRSDVKELADQINR